MTNFSRPQSYSVSSVRFLVTDLRCAVLSSGFAVSSSAIVSAAVKNIFSGASEPFIVSSGLYSITERARYSPKGMSHCAGRDA